MTSAIFWDFFTPSPTCLHLELICSIKFTQPPKLRLLFHDPPLPLRCGHHIWTLPKVKDKYGSVKQDLEKDRTHGGCVRRSWWIYKVKDKPPTRTCRGQTVRAVCNFATGDLPELREEAVASRRVAGCPC